MFERGVEMIIHKILNNNVVVILDEKDREQIVMGRGIAFKRKCGDLLQEDQIDKVFIMNNPDMVNKFQELVADIPIEYLELVEQIVTYAKTNIGKKINDSIYISLADHIMMSVERLQQGIVVKNALLWDIKRFYKEEFEIGLQAIEMINALTNVKLPEDEAGFIALHFVNAQMDEGSTQMQNMYEITKVMQEITNIVKYYFQMEFDENSVYFYRFITHLKFFAQRLITQSEYQEGMEDDLLEIIKVKYESAYTCVNKVAEFINTKYEYNVNDEERLYLTIHIARIVSKNMK